MSIRASIRPPHTSRHAIARRGLSPTLVRALEISAIVVVSALACAPSLSTKARITYDSLSYWHLSLYRLPVVPLLYTALTHNFTAIVVAQTLLGAFCWGYLAFCALKITRRPYCYIAVLCVLFASSTDYVTDWYTALLSDSLSLSLLALLLGSLASWLDDRGSLTRVMVVALLWAGTRDTNGYIMLLVGVIALATSLLRSRARAHIGAAIVAILGGVTVLWSTNRGGIWQQPFQHVLTERILPDPSKLAWFQSHGMPVNQTLLRISKTSNLASQNTLAHSPELAPFRIWMQTSGERAYLLYAVFHPVWAIRGTFGPQQAFNESIIQYYSRNPANRWIPLSIREPFLIGEQWLILISTAIAGLVLAVRIRIIRSNPRNMLWWLGVLIFGYVGLVVDWVGDSWEVGRHSIGSVIAIWVAAGFLISIGLGTRRSPDRFEANSTSNLQTR